MMLSIVTVTFNDLSGVRRTLLSIDSTIDVSDPGVEVLVKNGGSEDGMAGLRSDFPWARIITLPDKGTYDGMNQALAVSTGRYVWFLNGGDESVIGDWREVRALLESGNELLLCDYIRAYPTFSEIRRSRSAAYIWHALPTSHQAIFYPGDVARELRYDLSYPVSADYAFTARLLRDGVAARTLPVVVGRFHTGGLSTQRAAQVAKDAARVQREILGSSGVRRAASQARHLAARTISRVKNDSSVRREPESLGGKEK